MNNQKLTREQRRKIERLNKEADDVFNVLARQFRDEFLSEDPDSELVKETKNKVCAKWKVYCRSKGFKPEALPMMDEFCDRMYEDYKKEIGSVS